MKFFHCRICLRWWLVCLVVGTMLPAMARKVTFRSGEAYRISPMEWTDLVVSPLITDPEALTCCADRGQESLWTITLEADGFYSIRNVATGHYMTYDGVRTMTRRYVRLSRTDHGDASRWNIYVGQSGLLIAAKADTRQLLNVRRGSYIVGTYREFSTVATQNERFLLVDKRGQTVTHLGGKEISLELLPDAVPGSNPVRPTLPRPATAQTLRVPLLQFTLDGRQGFCEEGGTTYLFPVPESMLGNTYRAIFAARDVPSDAVLYIDGRRQSGRKIRFSNVGGGRTHRLALVRGGDTVQAASVTFTALPVLRISASHISSAQFVPGTIEWSDADGSAPGQACCKVRWRGDYSLFSAKKSMGIKVVGADGRKLNVALGGLRADNYWILDAMALDPARMRNRVGQDLWRDMATHPYYAHSVKHARNYSRGRLVEVFLDGRYHGVYNLCERIDRKQTEIERADPDGVRGLLFKADNWSPATRLGGNSGTLSTPAPTSASWNGWQVKYPEPSAKRQTDWAPLIRALETAGTRHDQTFRREIGRYFDLPVLRDYWLFIELLYATDNSGKNMYWAVHDATRDGRMTPIPWDMDGTFGNSWNGSRESPGANGDYPAYLAREGKDNYLFNRLQRMDVDHWNSRTAERYAELRRTVLDPRRLAQRFRHYQTLMERSGAADREFRRWHSAMGMASGIGPEVDYVTQWVKNRIRCLDRKYGY